jgi:Transposase
MDTSEQTTLETIKQTKRRRRSLEEKRRIVEETLVPGASVARVARRHAVNALFLLDDGRVYHVHLPLRRSAEQPPWPGIARSLVWKTGFDRSWFQTKKADKSDTRVPYRMGQATEDISAI